MGATMDKTQRNLMMALPLLFITVVSRFPVGLIIYWMTTNLWTVGQGLVTRRLVPKPATRGGVVSAPTGPKRSSRTPPKESENGAAAGEAKPKPAPPAQPRIVKRKKGGSRR
jgi:YidC/Oxa1 family membrane protein insertase